MVKHKPDSPGQTTHTPLQRKWWVWGLSAAAVLLIVLSVIHLSDVRYRFDPLAALGEQYKLATARSTTGKASAQLSIAESRLADFEAVYAKDPSSPLLHSIADDMVNHDQAAMQYMDDAKMMGLDIKRDGLVKRLCDGLKVQNQKLAAAKAANSEVAEMSEQAESMEEEANHPASDLNHASDQVEQGLNKAMQW